MAPTPPANSKSQPLTSLDEWEDFLRERYPAPQERASFRDYGSSVRPSVREFYRLNHRYQTIDFVQEITRHSATVRGRSGALGWLARAVPCHLVFVVVRPPFELIANIRQPGQPLIATAIAPSRGGCVNKVVVRAEFPQAEGRESISDQTALHTDQLQRLDQSAPSHSTRVPSPPRRPNTQQPLGHRCLRNTRSRHKRADRTLKGREAVPESRRSAT